VQRPYLTAHLALLTLAALLLLLLLYVDARRWIAPFTFFPWAYPAFAFHAVLASFAAREAARLGKDWRHLPSLHLVSFLTALIMALLLAPIVFP